MLHDQADSDGLAHMSGPVYPVMKKSMHDEAGNANPQLTLKISTLSR